MTAINFNYLTPRTQLQSGDIVRYQDEVWIVLFQREPHQHPVAYFRGLYLCRKYLYGRWQHFSTYARIIDCPEAAYKIGDTCDYSSWELQQILT